MRTTTIAMLAILCSLFPNLNYGQSLVNDDIVVRRTHLEREILPYDHIRESDVFYSKKIWRVIDVREKMNLAFAYPSPPLEPFAKILIDLGLSGETTYYDAIDDRFTVALSRDDLKDIVFSEDTITIYGIDGEEEQAVVPNQLNYENIKKFRIKEMWVFDEETSTMVVRILGIAPILDKYDDNGNYMGELPLFWAYYPELRNYLVNNRTFNIGNDAHQLSYTDVLEARMFGSYIYKESNVHDRRIQDYATGIDGLLEGERIKHQLFEFEHNLWSY